MINVMVKTEEEYQKLMVLLEEMGFKWANGESPVVNHREVGMNFKSLWYHQSYIVNVRGHHLTFKVMDERSVFNEPFITTNNFLEKYKPSISWE